MNSHQEGAGWRESPPEGHLPAANDPEGHSCTAGGLIVDASRRRHGDIRPFQSTQFYTRTRTLKPRPFSPRVGFMQSLGTCQDMCRVGVFGRIYGVWICGIFMLSLNVWWDFLGVGYMVGLLQSLYTWQDICSLDIWFIYVGFGCLVGFCRVRVFGRTSVVWIFGLFM